MTEVTVLDFMADKDEQMTLLTEVEHLKEMIQAASALNAEAALRDKTSIKSLQLEIIDRERTEKETLFFFKTLHLNIHFKV